MLAVVMIKITVVGMEMGMVIEIRVVKLAVLVTGYVVVVVG